MTESDLKARTLQFGLQIIALVDNLPRKPSADAISRQLVRSATSIGANYRADCRARSRADFVAKLAIVEEEADESAYWLELLAKSGHAEPAHLRDLWREAEQITKIIVASIKTARAGARRPKTTTDSTQK